MAQFVGNKADVSKTTEVVQDYEPCPIGSPTKKFKRSYIPRRMEAGLENLLATLTPNTLTIDKYFRYKT